MYTLCIVMHLLLKQDKYIFVITRFRLTHVENNVWLSGVKDNFGGFSLTLLCFYLISYLLGLSVNLLNTGERNPVDCAKRCLDQWLKSGHIGNIGNCNAFTFQEGVCTLASIDGVQKTGALTIK